MSSWRSPRRVLTVNCLQHDEALIFPLILASAGFIAVNPRPGLQVAFSSVVGKQIRLLQSALTDFDRIVRTLVTKYLCRIAEFYSTTCLTCRALESVSHAPS